MRGGGPDWIMVKLQPYTRAGVTKMLKTAFAAALLLGTTALTAFAGTTVLNVPNQYGTIGAAVAAANADTNLAHDYVISVAAGTYTNDTAEVDRPMTI